MKPLGPWRLELAVDPLAEEGERWYTAWGLGLMLRWDSSARGVALGIGPWTFLVAYTRLSMH